MKTVGIIGGMGPLATVDLMTKMILLTPAKNDQEHIHMIVDNYPQIPDRTSAIIEDGINPLPFMIQSARRLEMAGADMLAIACNTAHYFLPDIQAAVSIPIINMPKETVNYIKETGLKRIALLATDGTLATKLYQNYLSEGKITVLIPDEMTQARVMEGIYAVKSGDTMEAKEILLQAAETMITAGAEAVIAGCTEIPCVLSEQDGINVIDPSFILARRIVDLASGSLVYS
ncbi:amino acid racemase [Neobacillus sp. YIM B02564]|uniref:Amino acid racemase n=1 Tax=Neobacillus paridis TaxID=2803862 RepID=A0ABS1TTZ9_9BACI|nr:amino acid racemase [Neobacillus paridis]MBL4954787.1 amino acid racemase [Neobacillus paridis]